MKGGGASLANTYEGIIISDIHCSAFDAKIWYDELDKEFLEPLQEREKLDFVVITGDLFHGKISINSQYAKMVMKFLLKLIAICKDKDAKLRIIKGTESHDNYQLDVIEILFRKSDCDLKIIHTVETEWLFEDMQVLYLPEEYIPDMKEYYGEYFKNTYDMVFGHGMINEVAHIAVGQESEETMSRAPIFNVNELISISKGPIFFGHIHKQITYKDQFFYVNSFSRWAFGEEGDKGYYQCTYSPSTTEYDTKYIVNKSARRFDTLSIVPEINKPIDEQVNYIVKLANSLVIDYLRVTLEIPEEYENPGLITTMINEVFASHRKIKVKIVNHSKVKKKREMEEKITKLLNNYGFIFDKTLTRLEKLQRYIEKKYGRNISLDRLSSYVGEDVVKGEEAG